MSQKQQNKLLYDWLSFTFKIVDDIESTFYLVKDLLGFDHSVSFDACPGAKGFTTRNYFNGVSIHTDNPSVDYIWVEMSGQGCRAYESYGGNDFDALLAFLSTSELSHITRLDVAYDDFTDKISLDQICADTLIQNYISRCRSWQVTQSNKGSSVVIGSMDSDILIRIYDKAAERGYKDGRHWTRIELQLRRDNAIKWAQLPGRAGDKFAGVLRNYLRYVSPSKDSNKTRWPLAPYWEHVIGEAEKISLFTKPGVEYNLSALERYVYKQPNMAIQTLISLVGEEVFLKELKKHTPDNPNPKYEQLRKEYKLYLATEPLKQARSQLDFKEIFADLPDIFE